MLIRITGLALILALILAPLTARAKECPSSASCVPNHELQDLREKNNCLVMGAPTVTVDPVTVSVDSKGRVSGTSTKLYTVHVEWCNQRIDVPSQLEVQSARQKEPKLGFRLRLKAAFGLLARDLIDGRKFLDSGDFGLMVEPFFFHLATLNGFIGFRSVGGGLGHDITDSFGLALLFNVTWDDWRANPFLTTYFNF